MYKLYKSISNNIRTVLNDGENQTAESKLAVYFSIPHNSVRSCNSRNAIGVSLEAPQRETGLLGEKPSQQAQPENSTKNYCSEKSLRVCESACLQVGISTPKTLFNFVKSNREFNGRVAVVG